MKEMNKKFTIENSSCLFIEPKSMGNKLIIEPIEPRVYWFFSDSNNSVLGIFYCFLGTECWYKGVIGSLGLISPFGAN